MSKRFRLSATQQSFLSESIRNPTGGLGILQLVLTFEEVFDADAFHRALQCVVDRHDSLRKFFPLQEGVPCQVIVPQASAVQALQNWTQLSGPVQQQNFELFLQTDRHTPFDLETAPLIRCAILLYRPRFTKVILTLHHLLVDGQSLQIVFSEIVRSYDAFCQGSVPHLSPPISDVDFLDFLSCAPSKETQKYWEDLLHQATPDRYLASLQTDHDQPAAAAQQQLSTTFSRSELKRLEQTARRYSVAVPTLAYGAWALTLHRFSQSQDILFLATRRGRHLALPGMEHAVGCFINTAPVRTSIDRRTHADVFLQQLEHQWKASAPHEHASLSHIHAWQKWDVSSAAWDSNFVYRHDSLASAFARSALPGTCRHAVLLQHSDHPLTVAVTRSQSLCVDMQYRASFFRAGSIENLLASYSTILMDLASQHEATLGRVNYLSPKQQDFLCQAAGTMTPRGGEELLHHGFETQARLRPWLVALHDENGSLTYGELDRLSVVLALDLLADGLQPEEPVGILMPRSQDLLIALLATLRAGGCYLPLEPAHSDEVLRELVLKAGVRRLLARPSDRIRAVAIAPVDGAIISSSNHCAYASKPLPRCSPAQLAYLIPTSGTTGGPKLVEIEHRAAGNTIRHSIEDVYRPADLALVPWLDSPAFDAGIHQVFAPLSVGGSLVLVQSMESLLSSPWLNRLTVFGATPSVLITLLDTGAFPTRAKTVMFGGESFPAKLPHLLLQCSSVRKAMNVYGPAEASIYCTAIDTLLPASTDATPSGRNIGKPIRNTFVSLLDESLQPVPPGAKGEICIGGIGLARGYRGDVQLTQQRFTTVTMQNGISRRVYRTGDLGMLLPEGDIEFCGRADRQVKVNGIRIELEAVEQALQALADVQLAVVFVAQVSGVASLCACVQTSADICLQSLQASLRKNLPKGVTLKQIHQLRCILLTPNGKPDVALLRTIATEAPVARPILALADPHSSAVAKVWEELLGHSNFRVDDDFFHVGGDSLLALHLVLRLNIEMCSSQSWTVASMAQALASPGKNPHLVRVGARASSRRFWVMPLQSDIASLDANTDESFWALSAQMESIADPARHILDLADACMQNIRRVQPTGPYIVGGFCFGGYLAFELATRLESEGEQVTLLLLDRPGPSARARRLDALVSPWRSLSNQLRLGYQQSSPRHLTACLREAAVGKWRSKSQGAFNRAAAAALAYRPAVALRGRLILMESRYSRFPFPSLLPRRGWEDLSCGPLQIVRLSDHVQTFGPQQWSKICLFDTTAFPLAS